jgi:hypothetical protein
MRTTKLSDGTLIFCLLPTEASVLDHHGGSVPKFLVRWFAGGGVQKMMSELRIYAERKVKRSSFFFLLSIVSRLYPSFSTRPHS